MSARRKKQEEQSWTTLLDQAVMEKWPEVTCETTYNIFSMNMVTSWWQAGTEDTKLKPSLAREVRGFVAGFMAAWEAKL